MPSKAFREAVEAEYEAITSDIHERIVFFDTIQILLRGPLSGRKLAQIQAAMGGEVHYFTRKQPNAGYPRRLLIQLPTQAGLKLLHEFAPEHLVNRLDVALDLTVKDQGSLEILDDFIFRRLVQPWHGKRHVQTSGSVRYFARDPWTNRNLAIYSDRPSKITGGPCLHIEMRIRNAAACRRYKASSISDLPSVDIHDLIRRQIRLTAVDPSCLARVIETYARSTLRGMRRREDKTPRAIRARRASKPWHVHWNLERCRHLVRSRMSRILQTEDHAPQPERVEFEHFSAQRLKESFRGSVSRCLVNLDVERILPVSNEPVWVDDEPRAP